MTTRPPVCAADGTGGPAPLPRLKTALTYLTSPLLCLAVWWRIPFFFFRDDDFNWLTLPQLPLTEALFSPFAQGTVRVLSERLYFLTLTSLFGFHPWPFRLTALLAWFAVLALMQWIGARLTGSRAAGLLAALLWTIALPLAIPLGWASAFNQVLIALVVLAAFGARLQGWRRAEAVLYLAGFGVLEIIVMYPLLVLLHSWTDTNARARWREALWMFVPAGLFTALHLFVIPRSESPVYQRIFDGRLPGTLWQYIVWSIGPSQMQVRNPARIGQGLAVTWAIAAALAVFALTRLRQRDKRPLLFGGWFLLWIAPVLPLPNHISDYYVTLPGIGLAWLAGWALVSAWRAGSKMRVPAVVLAFAYTAGSVAEIDALTKWYLGLTTRGAALFHGVEITAQRYPGQAILLTHIDNEAFLHTLGGYADRTLGVQHVWLPPGQDNVVDTGGVPDLRRFRVAPAVLADALSKDQIRVLDVSGLIAADVTDAYRAANTGAGASN